MRTDYEKRGLKIAMAGSFLLSLSAIIMALITKSQAILLDGLYTFVALIMAFVSLKVVNLVKTPETKERPFGYMAFEPFLNLIKSLVMLTILVVFLVTNIQELTTGGRIISLDMATLYILICLVIYVIIIFLIKRCEKETDSTILSLEIKILRIDALLTLGIAVSLIAAMIMVKLGYTQILPYVDPVIVIILIGVSLPIPINVFLTEFKRLLLISSENDIEKEVNDQIQPEIQEYGLTNIHVWSLKSGRTHYIFLYLDLKEKQVTIEHLDKIRRAIFSKLSKLYPDFWADIIFTKINPEEPIASINEPLNK
ncbi:MAG: cation transporter [Bacteroidales bacterium]|nr:cation transporter [Bacteroidota bacterium]MBL6950669.1 cation transporter [Bacteroidales bacterium]